MLVTGVRCIPTHPGVMSPGHMSIVHWIRLSLFAVAPQTLALFCHPLHHSDTLCSDVSNHVASLWQHVILCHSAHCSTVQGFMCASTNASVSRNQNVILKILFLKHLFSVHLVHGHCTIVFDDTGHCTLGHLVTSIVLAAPHTSLQPFMLTSVIFSHHQMSNYTKTAHISY